jgi:hypothetical protein
VPKKFLSPWWNLNLLRNACHNVMQYAQVFTERV